MQAILTKYLAQTDSRGARIKATAAAGSITIDYPHELSGEDVHRAAAEALVGKLGWTGPHYGVLHGGQLPSGDWCFVLVKQLPAPAPTRDPRDVKAMESAASQLEGWPVSHKQDPQGVAQFLRTAAL